MASEETLRLSSSAASSSSRRTSELARSETLFTVAPRPGVSCSVSWVCMASPVDDLGEHDPGDERGTDDDQRRWPLPPLRFFFFVFGREPSCGPEGAGGGSWLVGASPLARALIRLGFSLRRKAASFAELLGEPLADAVAACGRAVGEVLQAVGPAIDQEVALVHLLHRRRLARGDAPELRGGSPRGHGRDRGEARVETGPEQLSQHAGFVA